MTRVSPSTQFRRAQLAILASALFSLSGCRLPDGPWPGVDTSSGLTGASQPSDSGASSSSDDNSGTTSPGQTPGFSVSLRADSNRDGRVDLSGPSDLADRITVTRDKGALFLANLDDDSGRCNYSPSQVSETCYDASDEVVNGPEDAKDLAVIQSVPMAVSEAAFARISVSQGPADKVRLFVQTEQGQYRALAPNERFSAAQIRSGLKFALEGKDIARDKSKWDGTIRLRLDVKDAERQGSDEVALRVAPILTHTHQDAVDQLVASPLQEPLFDAFRRDLQQALKNAKIAKPPLYLRAGNEDEWAQDYFEPFYASVPGPNGPQSMRVLVRSDQDRVAAHLGLYDIAGPDLAVTAVRLLKGDDDHPEGRGLTYNSFGNLETIPPIKGFPSGRQVVGGSIDKKIGPSDVTIDLLKAQGVQDPIWLDVTWLAVGHLDEFISFVPSADAALGFKVLVADPVGTLNLLRQAVANGHGNTPMRSYVPITESEKKRFNETDIKTPTIKAFVDDPQIQKTQAYAESKIAENLEHLRTTIGLLDKDIVRIPSLYWEGSNDEVYRKATNDDRAAGPDSKPSDQYLAAFPPAQRPYMRAQMRAQQAKWQDDPEGDSPPIVGAFLPAAMNMVVLPKHRYILMAKQFGPKVNGVDLVQEAVSKAIQALGYTPQYVDDFLTYSRGSGDLHCGTNTLRVPRTTWWAK